MNETIDPLASQPAPESELTQTGYHRRLRFRLRRAARVLEHRERLQEIVYGLLLAAFALALPSARDIGSSDVFQRLSGETVLTQGLLYPVARGFVHVLHVTPRAALLVISALCYGGAFTATLAFLRRLGFRRTSSLPAALTAFLAPYSWLGATSPSDYALGMLGASLVLWTLFRLPQSTPKGYQWRALLILGLAYMLHPEGLLLLPAVAWAVARHPAYRAQAGLAVFSVVLVFVMSVAIGLSGRGETARIEHLVMRVLAGAEPGLANMGRWAITLPLAFGVSLLGLYQLLFGARESSAQRAPAWVVPWCLVGLAPVVAGSPEFGPVGSYLVPAAALGLADWFNRRGSRRAELRLGLALVAIQAALVIALAAGWIGGGLVLAS